MERGQGRGVAARNVYSEIILSGYNAGMKPCTKVSARRVGGRFILYRAGRVAGESVHSGPALDWLSEQLRIPGHELSSLSDLTGADVAAHRADQSALICGADWRVSQE